MSNTSVKDAFFAILSKSKTIEEATEDLSLEEIDDLEMLIKSINKKTGDGRYGRPNPDVEIKEILKTDKNGQWSIDKAEILEKPPVSEAQRKAMWAAAKGKSNLGIPKSVGKDFAEADRGGKLPEKKMEKAIKPGPTLDYKKMNPKPNYDKIEAEAPTINYHNNTVSKPTYSGAKQKRDAVRAKINAEASETALDTFKRRGQMKKEEGVNSEPELASDKKKRMVTKNEMLGYGPQGSPQSATIMQSEKEPHKDDPKHEEKEQIKAKKIKQEAQDLLDMHKDESGKPSSLRETHHKTIDTVGGPKKQRLELHERPTHWQISVHEEGKDYPKVHTGKKDYIQNMWKDMKKK